MLVTHSVQWLPVCDSIVVMDQGQIIQIGSYEDLLAHDGPFARYLKTYLRQDTEDLDPDGTFLLLFVLAWAARLSLSSSS